MISLRYLYSNLGEAESTTLTTPGYQLNQPLTVNMHSSSLLLGFNYGFGSGDVS